MKYLIISAYDGTCGFSVCENGNYDCKVAYTLCISAFENAGYCYTEESEELYVNWLKTLDYDFIVYCNNGAIRVVKDITLNKEVTNNEILQ